MPLDEAFQSSTDAVLLDMAQRPRPPVKQAPAFSVWGLLKAPATGATAGVAQAAGSIADVFSGAAQVSGALGTEDWLMPDPVKAAKDTEAARRRLQEQGGPDVNSELGRSLRNVARDYMPDPVTAHGAEQAVANLFRVGAKAVGAGVVLGPVGGAVAAGAEEGMTAASDLADQGVDLGTRTKVGAVTAAVTAAGFALPVAGQTWARTAGLAVAGGPASFIAQNAATREILQAADYGALANQYDPFDPLGLALSTIVPLGFGALAMRGARGAAPEAARAGDGVEPTATPRPDAATVDAARVNLLRENIDATRPAPASNLAAGAAHDAAMARAIDQLAAGERVSVTDVAPAGFARIVDELAPRLSRAAEELAPSVRALEQRIEPEPFVPADLGAPRGEPVPVAGAAQAPVAAVRLVSEAPDVERAVNVLEAERPDLMVHIDGMDAPVPLAELMERVRADLGREVQEAPLIEAAAACFISTGS